MKKARERIGEKKYSAFSNNCEHFATECKTGEKDCHQKGTPKEIVVKSALATIGSCVRAWKANIDEKKKNALATQRMILSILEKIFSKAKAKEIMEMYGTQIVSVLETMVSSISEKILSNAKAKEIIEVCRATFNPVSKTKAKYHEIFNHKYVASIAGICELFLFFCDYYKAEDKASNNNLTKEQFIEVVIKRICAAVFSIPGFWFSNYLGGMLSIAICGWALPAFLVSIIAGAAGDFAAKQLGGKFADAVVIPLFEWLLSEAKKYKIL